MSIEDIKTNPVTVPLTCNIRRVIFDTCGDPDIPYDEEGLFVGCGPETPNGFFSDEPDYELDEKVQTLFSDLNIEMQVMENTHCIPPVEGISEDEMRTIVETRLERSGAVRFTPKNS